MVKLYNTAEVAANTGLNERTIRRRIESAAQGRSNGLEAWELKPVAGGRVTYGVSEASLKDFKERNAR